MQYEVIHFFTDLQDDEYPYSVGDPFPRAGMAVSAERLAELSGSSNRQGKPLIRAAGSAGAEPSPAPAKRGRKAANE